MAAYANILVFEGRLNSEIRSSIDINYDVPRADFWLTAPVNKDKDGQLLYMNVLCRVLGSMTSHVLGLQQGARLVLDGKLRYSNKIAYIESWNVET